MRDIPRAERMLVDNQQCECGLPSQFRTGPDHALHLVIQLDDPGPALPRLALAGVLPSLHTLAEALEHLPHHPAGIGRHGSAHVGAQEIPVEKALVSHPYESQNKVTAGAFRLDAEDSSRLTLRPLQLRSGCSAAAWRS